MIELGGAFSVGLLVMQAATCLLMALSMDGST